MTTLKANQLIKSVEGGEMDLFAKLGNKQAFRDKRSEYNETKKVTKGYDTFLRRWEKRVAKGASNILENSEKALKRELDLLERIEKGQYGAMSEKMQTLALEQYQKLTAPVSKKEENASLIACMIQEKIEAKSGANAKISAYDLGTQEKEYKEVINTYFDCEVNRLKQYGYKLEELCINLKLIDLEGFQEHEEVDEIPKETA